jgi:replicative DNA helicase
MTSTIAPAAPAAPELEKVILGAVMLDNMAFYTAQEAGLTAEDFSLPSHSQLWTAMGDLLSTGLACDEPTLVQKFLQEKKLSAIGGAAYISGLTEGIPRRPVIEQYIRTIRDKALGRRLMEICSRAVDQAADQSEPAAETLNSVIEQIQNSAAQVIRHGKQIGDLDVDEAAKFDAECDMEAGGTLGASVFTPEVDRVTNGLMEGELCIIAGRPHSGKTEAALQLTLANARRGLRVHFQSMEMKAGQLQRRLWRLIAKVPVSAMRDPRCLTPDQRKRISQAREELCDLPIFIDDAHELKVSDFRSRALLAAKRWKADLIVADYAQLIIVPRARSIVEAAPAQAETLRHVARDYCRMVALAQLRRAPPQDLNKYPDVEDLLGSSAFEQAAQVILMLHRSRKDKEYTGEDFCFLGKMRELQSLRAFGSRAEKWGEYQDRFEPGPKSRHLNDNED